MQAIHIHLTLCPGCNVEYTGCDGSRLTITCKETSQDAIEKVEKAVQEATRQINVNTESLTQGIEKEN